MPPIEAIDGSCETSDGLALHYRAWLPPAARGVLLIVHGLAEHSGRYAHVGPRFAGAGYAAYALDHRGHGLSPGRRVHVGRFAEYLDDVDALTAVVRARHPALPPVLVGHSQGGLVVLGSALERPRGLAGAIVSSPLLGVHPATRASPVLIAAARLLSVLWPSVLISNHVDASRLSRDPAVGRAYLADPLVSHRVSPRWLTAVSGAIARVQQDAPSLSIPVLLMISGADRIVDPEASVRFASRAPAQLVDLVRWDGFYHEMFNEPDRETVFRRMEAWLAARVL